MSGLVVIYSRALSRGDCVRIGDAEGVVTEVHLLSTRLLTVQGEEVTIPNTVVVNGPVKNFGRAVKGRGALVSTRVSVGYDTPWRKVHGLLLDAARETPGIRADPVPYVLQRALDDFDVQYELFVAAVGNPVDRPLVASALHTASRTGSTPPVSRSCRHTLRCNREGPFSLSPRRARSSPRARAGMQTSSTVPKDR